MKQMFLTLLVFGFLVSLSFCQDLPSYTDAGSLSSLRAAINNDVQGEEPFLWWFETTKSQSIAERHGVNIYSLKNPDSGQTPYGDFVGLQIWSYNNFNDDQYRYNPTDTTKYNCVTSLLLSSHAAKQWGSCITEEILAAHDNDASGALTALNLHIDPLRPAAITEPGKFNSHTILRLYNFSPNATPIDTAISCWGSNVITRFISKDQNSLYAPPHVGWFADLDDWTIDSVGINFSGATIKTGIAINLDSSQAIAIGGKKIELGWPNSGGYGYRVLRIRN